MADSVYRQLEEMRAILIAIHSYERLGREEEAVLDAVVASLIELGEIAADLPHDVIEAEPRINWSALVDVSKWRRDQRTSFYDQAWRTVDGFAGLDPILSRIALEYPSGSEHRGWFDVDGGRRDYSYADSEGSRGIAALIIPGVGEIACRYLATGCVWLQVPTSEAPQLSADVGMHLYLRRLGLGRVRKDGSTPLEPPGDRIWIQSVLGEATLVMRHRSSESGYAYIRLGRLARSMRTLAALFGRVQVQIVEDDAFLPDALWSAGLAVAQAGRAWGGLVATTPRG